MISFIIDIIVTRLTAYFRTFFSVSFYIIIINMFLFKIIKKIDKQMDYYDT